MGEIADYHVDQMSSGRWSSGYINTTKKEKCEMAAPVKNTDTKVVTGKARLSYVHVFEPHAIEDGQEPKYSVCLLIPKSDKETLRKIKAAVEAAKTAGAAKWGGKVPANLKTPLRDGDEERSDQPEYEGHYFINCSSKTKPGVVDARVQPILDSTEIYSGCYGRASINFYAFNTAGNKGIACGLNNIQKLADGDYLGGRSRAEDDFDAVDDFEDDDDFLS
jgi:hypothetical protein